MSNGEHFGLGAGVVLFLVGVVLFLVGLFVLFCGSIWGWGIWAAPIAVALVVLGGIMIGCSEDEWSMR